ncbi:isochorismate synthase [Agrococcus carbonis]|uniref:isochorismate synthase n=1 Tax=Agrococcus carbonis TaxID=684552 RepID=A0A1H1MQN3_9MICO|nr:isochorismate synthase [Agrococcus carbonis]SDR89046.1 isochorismate synthase [Agrococcus carbonis]
MPSLRVRTERAEPGRLLQHADPRAPLAIRRGADGVVGRGEAMRLEFRGPTRFTDAADAWRQVARDAVVDDAVGVPGTGLIAFGAFAFDDASTATSVLIVPKVVVGRRGDDAWITWIGDEGVLHPTAVEEVRVELTDGAIDPARYRAMVVEATERIRAGEAEKVVVARDRVGRLPQGGDVRSVAVGLVQRYPDAVTYAVDGVIGASPETLIAAHRGHFFSRVLAGTAARGATPALDAEIAEALASGDKDLREHRYAADSALEVLLALAPDARASEPFPLRLPNLWHLATDISGTLGDRSTLDVLALLHPTAAVAGTPRAASLALIRELEGVDRGRYAGPVGWIDGEGGGEWVIALRGAEIAPDGSIRAFAGAGIVAGSDADAELAETAVKLRPITDALADPLPGAGPVS